MKIRESEERDIPQIVEVLKASLGEKDLPLSNNIWNYKHVHNPFGKSLVFVAEENGKIIGVRAFMRWQWIRKEKVYSTFRAVDTATHPEYQGRGIFKTLTLTAVEKAQENEDHFIFNTPNKNSKPGYIKMGWQIVDNVKVSIRPFFPGLFQLFKVQTPIYKVSKRCSPSEIEKICQMWNSRTSTENLFYTPRSAQYLEWRFEMNPLQNYEVLATSDFYLAAYIKSRGKIKELRIAECISSGAPEVWKEINYYINEIANKFGAQFISTTFFHDKFGPGRITGKFGPVLTVKDLNLEEGELQDITVFSNWKPSIGDLELF